MKKTVIFLVFLFLVGIVITGSVQASLDMDKYGITIVVEGKVVDGESVLKYPGTTMVPVRPIFEAMGLSVDWKEDESIEILGDGISLIMYLNSNLAYVNGELKDVDPYGSKILPQIINGRTMVPARFVTKTFGYIIEFNGSVDIIFISREKMDQRDRILIEISIEKQREEENVIENQPEVEEVPSSSKTPSPSEAPSPSDPGYNEWYDMLEVEKQREEFWQNLYDEEGVEGYEDLTEEDKKMVDWYNSIMDSVFDDLFK